MSSSSPSDAPPAEGWAAKHAATIWLAGDPLHEVNLLRRLWDGQSDAVAAHITIVYPQVPSGTVEAILDVASRAASQVRPFRVDLDRWTDLDGLRRIHPLGTRYLTEAFPGFAQALVLLPSRGVSEILGLRSHLDAAFGQPPEILDHPPFLTIGQGLDDQQAAAARISLAKYRPNLTMEVHAFDILGYDDDGNFRTLRSLSLGR